MPGARTGPQWTAVWQQCSLVDSFVEEQQLLCPAGHDFNVFLGHQLDASDIMDHVWDKKYNFLMCDRQEQMLCKNFAPMRIRKLPKNCGPMSCGN